MEQSSDPAAHGQEIAELKRILLARIAELEMTEALKTQSVSSGPVELPAAVAVDLPLPEAMVSEKAADEVTTAPSHTLMTPLRK